ncbi:hypothetical protein L6164_000927 [Bauhinia variegata]|uniref:Uncharacterized protein n=1 Tax=Bauhinia variegata TaxID=167791 RepID=A0ACB9Q7Y5_BAUVA|nr:hypothetical protein L6164_000927 [Bauhinia variegata]
MSNNVNTALTLACEFYVLSISHSNKLHKTTKFISVNKPPRGWFKVNCDASTITDPGSISIGGVLRDDQGSWIAGLSGKLGDTSVSLGELWSIFHGLKLALFHNIKSIIVESDSSSCSCPFK